MEDFDNYLSKIGAAIKQQRTLKKLTQEDVTKKTRLFDTHSGSRRHLAQETLSRIENGRFNPSLRQIYLISRALEIAPADLLVLAERLKKR